MYGIQDVRRIGSESNHLRHMGCRKMDVGKTDRHDVVEAIRPYYDPGVTSIDTTPIYGMGDSENIVGEVHMPWM